MFTFHPNIEGGYTVDNGGPTNYGMTQNTLDAYNRQNGYPQQSVKDITQDDAKHIAKQAFFDAPGISNLPDRTAAAAFDYSINSGPHQAIKDLQRAVGAKPDGIMGPQTQGKIEKYIAQNGEDALLENYIGQRQELMQTLITRNPKKYGPSAHGWANRISMLKTYLKLGEEDGN